jgi:hypothetical protein
MSDDPIRPILTATDRFIATGPDWQNNACIGKQLPPSRGMRTYADGFRSAARRLVEQMIEGETIGLPVDTAVYPVVFLYRHHVELVLKMIILSGRQMVGETGPSPLGHRLDKLWELARSIAERCFPNADRSQHDIVTALLAELSTIDANGEAGRYPSSMKGEPHFAEHALLNVRHFAETAEQLSEYLSFLLMEMKETNRVRLEYEAAMQDLHGCEDDGPS